MGKEWGKMGKQWVKNEIKTLQKTGVLMQASAGLGGRGGGAGRREAHRY